MADSQFKGGGGEQPSSPPAVSSSTADGGANAPMDGRPKTGTSVEARPTPNGRSLPNKLIRNLSSSHTAGTTNQPGAGPDGRGDLQTAIDPLSHHILKRTHTENMIPPKLRAGVTLEADADGADGGTSVTGARSLTVPDSSRGDGVNVSLKDKKKGVSFLSRFIGSKKKDAPVEYNDDVSESGDNRKEGTDADVFSQPIGFIPRFPMPPRYIKVRSHGKKEKEFNRVFLAQELRGRTGVEIAQSGGRLTRNSTLEPSQSAKDSNAIWALEFSKDGKHLAAGGQDSLVRIWAVISTAEEREAHEKEEDATGKDGEGMRLNAPVFKTKPLQEYEGHTASVLDLSWSKNNFLLSSSMDKTVRLWHISRSECLCCFKHSDFVTSIQFHPRDDRFFLAGSLDSKLRLWSIPDKSVAFWIQMPDLITAVAFTPDGKTAIAGSLNGMCSFYETEGLKYNTQIHVRSSHGRNTKGSKITGIQAINFPPEDPSGEVKLLITSNDSRIRLYNFRDKGLEMKFKGNENTCSQIHASFSDDARYVICGSEDRKAYIWSTGPAEREKDKRPVEIFEAHSAIVTTAVMAPTKTKQLLGSSGDPLYDLCNPPPVTLVSRIESTNSSHPSTDNGIATPQLLDSSIPPTPATPGFTPRSSTRPPNIEQTQSPAYIARSAHPNGNIIVTADYLGKIKVFRQDCAWRKRRNNEAWDAASTFSKSKKMIPGRATSVTTRNSTRSRSAARRDSLTHPPATGSERILSWRNSIANSSASLVSGRHRSQSPRRIRGQHHVSSSPSQHRASPPRHAGSTPLTTTHPTGSPRDSVHKPSLESFYTPDQSRKTSYADPQGAAGDGSADPDTDANPLMLQGEQSYLFWNRRLYNRPPAPPASGSALGIPVDRHPSAVSAVSSILSSEEESDGAGAGAGGDNVVPTAAVTGYDGRQDDDEGGELKCRQCGGLEFRARVVRGRKQRLQCVRCGWEG